MADLNYNFGEKKADEVLNQDVERDSVSITKGDLLAQEHVDPVLNAKMHLVNDVGDIWCNLLLEI